MDMKIDGALVRSEREKRAWSQEHLSKVSGLGLRTVQRIETTDTASYESAQALASVFSLDVADLRHRANGQKNRAWKYMPARKALATVCAAAVVALGSLFFADASVATQIMLDVDASGETSKGDEVRETVQLLIAEGKIAELRIDNVLRLTVSPKIQEDGKIFLTAQVFEYLVDEYVLMAEPKLLTANNKEAEIRIASDSGKIFRFLITPHAN